MPRAMGGTERAAATGESLAATAPVAAGANRNMEVLQMQPEDSKLPAEIEALCREPIVHDGQRAVTTEQLAQFYGVSPDNIYDNHRQNLGRFVEGQHFVRLTGAPLRELKNHPVHNRLVGARAAHLILWLERGAARHAKLLQTDKAWDVFGRLEDAYFVPGDESLAKAPALATRIRDAVSVFASYRRLGRLIGLDKNQATISANEATLKRTGENVLADVGVTHLLAPEQEAILTPTEIGKRLGGISARRVNLLLVQAGLQVAGQGGPDWEPTPAGSHYAKWQDTGKKQGGVPIRQLKWLASVLDVLRGQVAA